MAAGLRGHVDPETGQILDDWKVIGKLIAKGLHTKYYSVGNWKNVDIQEYGIIPYEIVAFGVQLKEDGSPAAISWFPKSLLNYTVTNFSYSWALSNRTTLNNDLLAKYEPDCKALIKPVQVRYGNISTGGIYSGFGTEEIYVDKLWLLSVMKDLSFYAPLNDTSRRTMLMNGTAMSWLTRDQYCWSHRPSGSLAPATTERKACTISQTGAFIKNEQPYTAAIAPGFAT